MDIYEKNTEHPLIQKEELSKGVIFTMCSVCGKRMKFSMYLCEGNSESNPECFGDS